MRVGQIRLVAAAFVLPLAGCSVLPDAYSGCNDPKPYQAAKEMEPLRVPAGADLPDTRNALKIPEQKSPALPLDEGSCLDHPPELGAAAVANAGAAAATAAAVADTSPSSRTPTLSMDDGRPWLTRIGVTYQPTTNIRFDGGSKVEFNSSTGFLVGLGYDVSDKLQVGANFTYDHRGYDGHLRGDEPGETFPVRGSLQSMGVMFDLTYYFMTGRFSPFITTGVGWDFVDTNLPTSPPQIGCWWDPWYGYLCQGFQDTANVDGFAYQAGAGLTYRVNPSVSLSGSYRVNWLDFPKAQGTPGFDGFQFIVNWGF